MPVRSLTDDGIPRHGTATSTASYKQAGVGDAFCLCGNAAAAATTTAHACGGGQRRTTATANAEHGQHAAPTPTATSGFLAPATARFHRLLCLA